MAEREPNEVRNFDRFTFRTVFGFAGEEPHGGTILRCGSMASRRPQGRKYRGIQYSGKR